MMEIKDERDNLANDICVRLSNRGVDLQELKNILYISMKNYEITTRSTEVAVLDSMKNEEILERFIITKKVAGRTERTLRFYYKQCKIILARIGKTYSDITADDIRYYMAIRLTRDKVSKTTVQNETRCLSSYFSWLQNEGYITANPMAKIEPIKKDKTKKAALTPMEIEKLRGAARDEREAAVIEVLLSTGCRVSELTQILLSEIDEDKVLVHGKGQKDRYCYLNAKAMFAIERYLAKRKDSNPYLFPKGKNLVQAAKEGTYKREEHGIWWQRPENVIAGHVEKSSIEAMMRRMAKRGGVDQANPHKLRRTFATAALKRGMPIMQVSRLLGHEQLSTTQIYLDLSDDDLAQAHHKYVV